MASSSQPPKIRVFLYSGGEIVEGEHGPQYSQKFSKGILIRKRIKYSSLCDKIYKTLDIDATMYTLGLCVRYPVAELSGTRYVLHKISDDIDLQFALELLNLDVHLFVIQELRNVQAADGFDTSQIVMEEVGLSSPVHDTNIIMSTEGVQGPLVREENIGLSAQAVQELVQNDPPSLTRAIPIVGNIVGGDSAYENIDAGDDDENPMYENVQDMPDVVEDVNPHYNSPPGFFSEVHMEESHMNTQWSRGAGRPPLYNASQSQLREGMQFSTKKELQIAVDRFHVMCNRMYVVSGNQRAWEIKCKLADGGCCWKLRASYNQGNVAWEIKRLRHEHTCINLAISQHHHHLSSRLVAREMIPMLKAQTSITPDAIIANIGAKYRYNISNKVAWLAKQSQLQV